MAKTFANRIVYTPEILRTHQNVEIRSEQRRACFSANANVLASVCPNLRSFLREELQIEPVLPVVILAGFSPLLLENLEQFMHSGFLYVQEDQKNELQSDFKYLGIPVNEEFWEKETPVPMVKVELKEDQDGDEEMHFDLDNEINVNDFYPEVGYPADEYDDDEQSHPIPEFSIDKVVVTIQAGEKSYKRKIFQCWICPQKVFRPHLFVKHVAESHPKQLHLVQGPYKCENCSTYFKTIGQYYRHTKSVTPVCFVESVCDVCGRTCKNKMELYNHKRYSHKEDEEAACDVCGKTFNQKHKVSRHKNYHHNDKQCEHCSQVFKGSQSLNEHIQTMHVENDKKRFICNVCGKGFGRKPPFQEHMDIHNDIKRYKCRLCDYRSASSSNRNKHEKLTHKYFRSKEKQ